MQIVKRHAGAFFLGRTKLTWAQRYQFLCGWLPWLSDGLGLIVTFFALTWTTLMMARPDVFDMPMAALSAASLTLFIAKTAKTLLLYPQKVGSGVRGALIASVAGLALTHTVGKAVLIGLLTSGKPFLRTPKCEDPTDFAQVLRAAWQETTLFGVCIVAIFAMIAQTGYDDPSATIWTELVRNFGDPARALWTTMLIIQSLPYAATVATAWVSAQSYGQKSRPDQILPATGELPKAA
jgi:hypothetical protein